MFNFLLVYFFAFNFYNHCLMVYPIGFLIKGGGGKILISINDVIRIIKIDSISANIINVFIYKHKALSFKAIGGLIKLYSHTVKYISRSIFLDY